MFRPEQMIMNLCVGNENEWTINVEFWRKCIVLWYGRDCWFNFILIPFDIFNFHEKNYNEYLMNMGDTQ